MNSRRRRLIFPSRAGALSRQQSTAQGCGPYPEACPGPGPAGKGRSSERASLSRSIPPASHAARNAPLACRGYRTLPFGPCDDAAGDPIT